MNYQEIEIKFYLNDLIRLQKIIENTNAEILQERIFEQNIRFDRQDGSLSEKNCILRLRRDAGNRITYKDAGVVKDGVLIRNEIEFSVDDFDAANRFLNALDYHEIMVYEKFRTTYKWMEAQVTLDELPYGNFTEIESRDHGTILQIANQLGLDWKRGIAQSYTDLFDSLIEKHGYNISDLTFENFKNIYISPSMLSVVPADE